MQSYFWEIFVCLIEALLITYLLYQKIGLNAHRKIRSIRLIVKIRRQAAKVLNKRRIFSFIDNYSP